MLTRHLLLHRTVELTHAERAIVRAAIREVRDYAPRETVVAAGQPLSVSMFLVEGLVSRAVTDASGARQLVAIQVAGDFVDLHGYPLRVLDHDVVTITASRFAVVPHSALTEIQHQHPELARKLWFNTLLDASMHRTWVFRLGRLKAASRIAHFLCEINARLMVVGLSDGKSFSLPLTQFDLGEICGLTSIHVNRVMKSLREQQLVSLRKSHVVINDLRKLIRFSHFDPGYLYLNPSVHPAIMGETAQSGHQRPPGQPPVSG